MKTIVKTAVMTIVILFIALHTTSHTYAQETDKTYIKIRVDGMSCPFCAYGLEKKIKKIPGAKNVTIQLKKGEVTFDVPVNKEPTKEKLQKVVKEAGFTPKEITYAKTPFKIKENE